MGMEECIWEDAIMDAQNQQIKLKWPMVGSYGETRLEYAALSEQQKFEFAIDT